MIHCYSILFYRPHINQVTTSVEREWVALRRSKFTRNTQTLIIIGNMKNNKQSASIRTFDDKTRTNIPEQMLK